MMKLMSLQRSTNTEKNVRFPSGKYFLSAISVTARNRLGTAEQDYQMSIYGCSYSFPSASFTGWPSRNLTAETNDLLFGEREERNCGALKQRNLPGSWSFVKIIYCSLQG